MEEEHRTILTSIEKLNEKLTEKMDDCVSEIAEVNRQAQVGRAELHGEIRRVEQRVDDWGVAQAAHNVSTNRTVGKIQHDLGAVKTKSEVNKAKLGLAIFSGGGAGAGLAELVRRLLATGPPSS